MDLSKLTPLRGWREFLGEVGVVVLGVLLALAAQQIVQDMQTRADERAFRETVDHEIGLNLFMYDVRSRQFDCDDKRVADLKNWLARARSGEQVPALDPLGPQTLTPYRSAWDNRDAQVFNHIPAERRQKYAEFYDELSNNWSMIQAEQERWSRLIPYAETGPLTLTDRRTIRPTVALIADTNAMLRANLPISRKIAEVLEVKEVAPDNLPANWLKHVGDCPSVIGSPAETSRLNMRELPPAIARGREGAAVDAERGVEPARGLMHVQQRLGGDVAALLGEWNAAALDVDQLAADLRRI